MTIIIGRKTTTQSISLPSVVLLVNVGSVLSSCRMPSSFTSRMRRASTLLDTAPVSCIASVSSCSSPTSSAICLASTASVRWSTSLRTPSACRRLAVLFCLELLICNWSSFHKTELSSCRHIFLRPVFVGKNVLIVLVSFTVYRLVQK